MITKGRNLEVRDLRTCRLCHGSIPVANTSNSSHSALFNLALIDRQLMDSLALLSWVRPGSQPGAVWVTSDSQFARAFQRTLVSIYLLLPVLPGGTTCLLKMKALHSFETSGRTYPATRRHIPEHLYLNYLTAVMFLTHALQNLPFTSLSSVVYFTVDFHARIFTTFLTKVRYSSVGIVTRLRADRPKSTQHRQ
jgi:hypothetical protein